MIKKIFLRRLMKGKLIFFMVVLTSLSATAEEILQKEEMDFENCLKVILISADKLSVTPSFTTDEQDFRVAEYKMADGILVISCNRKTNQLIVSSR